MIDWRGHMNTSLGGWFAGIGIAAGVVTLILLVLGIVKLIELIGAV